MAEYIEREALKEVVFNVRCGKHLNKEAALNLINLAIDNLSAADVVEVVHCGECIHNYGVKANCEFNPHDIVCDWWSTDGMDETDFCSRGERRSE